MRRMSRSPTRCDAVFRAEDLGHTNPGRRHGYQAIRHSRLDRSERGPERSGDSVRYFTAQARDKSINILGVSVVGSILQEYVLARRAAG